MDGHDVDGVTGVLARPAGSVHRLPVTLPVTGAVTAGETGDPCRSAVGSVNSQHTNIKLKYKIKPAGACVMTSLVCCMLMLKLDSRELR